MNTTPKTLVLGATGSIGYAVTANLLARHLPVTILVRNRAKAEALFLNRSTLTIIEGDVQDATLLNRVSMDKDFIFHGINYPYNKWFGNMDTATQKVIDAARPRKAAQNHATIILPGNVYNFGNTTEPIREDSQPNPCTRKGQLRVAIEAMLEQAANAGQCRVMNVRLPDFWGPNVLNEGVKPIFENALNGKALPWIVNADIPHQSVYTKDAAEIIVRLLLRDWALQTQTTSTIKPYEVWNYGGTVLPSMRAWFEQITSITGNSLNVQLYSRFIISVLGLFMPVLREVKEMLYLYENTILLDDQKVHALFPDFCPTPMKQALTETLTWFSEHELKRPFTPVNTGKPTVFA
ncbi:NAD-dependent epimerase/dehydratase family protein [Spirosoma sp. HMF4905]|uniref:NAD-dependent epimerase/dehydratase family protein n=1 Tax=Spirosoma arboris TaxID=2682092 RepID=A0A7K1S4K5_9BACT|nr:NAD-dependent epimerase/dehydratase family protein [Spirosoma arboris]MVM28734.1 NAD-dependent epimerase/dehydratase family protein [Spirosoma arboris]